MSVADCRRAVLDCVEAEHAALIRLSEGIHAAAEPAFRELESARLLREYLSARGLAVRAVPAGPETAFVAEAGTRGPLVILCAEYDALPGLGHACGHNLIAAAAAGAAVALARLAEGCDLRVRLVGCPAEETGGGKALLLEAGAFEGGEWALMVHPGISEQSEFTSRALGVQSARFLGDEGHPVRDRCGADAASAALLAETALGLLRNRLPEGAALVWARTDEPGRPSVRRTESSLLVEPRAATQEELVLLKGQVGDCLRGAALAAGCRLELRSPEPDYLDFRGAPDLAAAWARVLPEVGRTPGPDRGATAVTDMGNVSRRLPSLHAVMALGGGHVGPHEPAFERLAAGGAGRAWVREAAGALALTALDMVAGAGGLRSTQ